ncbi:hypothetical protein ILUMI_05227 [Ignelater luminosus]|uniref:PiggyBac transposable element-derived protein domain-containing protein n=1 Tax=Ignelater luminosus TaxID=2038154 RepID=A0A8K0GDS3_IGNLU|nr:hypothetical protein ILUMI_05227 [Ignelater luminosus]
MCTVLLCALFTDVKKAFYFTEQVITVEIPDGDNSEDENLSDDDELRFEEIKRFLHSDNNDEQIPRGQPRHDRLFKIHHFLNGLRNRLMLVPKEENMAVGDPLIPTLAKSTLKQCNFKRLHKWDYKVFVLSGVSGFSYDFNDFAGSTKFQLHQPDFGASRNVIVKLIETVPRSRNYKIFFDNWFTSWNSNKL